jgi:hypothetical protein
LFWWLKQDILFQYHVLSEEWEEEWTKWTISDGVEDLEDYSECLECATLLILDKTLDFWWTNEFVSKGSPHWNHWCPLGGSE